jgi:capsular exopolysaccharide synthesis family protein
MSRVDEAIRRAAERASQQPDTTGDATEPLDLQSERVQDLANEPFPLEMPERRRRSRSTASASAGVRQVSAAIDADLQPPAVHPVAHLDAPTSATSLLERLDDSFAQKIVADEKMEAASREQYRRLAATLHHQQADRGLKVVMIASAVPGEGKTLTAANLGLTFSESYQRSVLLIDADLRRPSLHKIFGTDNTYGLSDGLAASTDRKLPARRVSERLALVTGGQPTSDPMASLTSDRMRRLLHEAREAFDWIIVDTSPVVALPDANLLSSMVDGAVMVVKAGSTSYALAQRAIEALGKDRILGVVLNQAASVPHHSYYYEYGLSQPIVGTPAAPPGP